MISLRNIRPAAAKIARMLLVFALVFYTSLRAEILIAYGDEASGQAAAQQQATQSGEAAQPSQAEQAPQVENLAIYQRAEGEDVWTLIGFSSEGPRDVVLSGPAQRSFVVQPVYAGEPSPPAQNRNVAPANFIQWEKPDSTAFVTTDRTAGGGELILAPTANSDGAQVVAGTRAENPPAGSFQLPQLRVSTEGFDPRLEGVVVTDASGTDVGAAGIQLERSALPAEVQLQAQVTMANMPAVDPYTVTWSVSGSEVATVGAEGLLSVPASAEASFTVSCAVSVPATGEARTVDVPVTVAGEAPAPEDPEKSGESEPAQTVKLTAVDVLDAQGAAFPYGQEFAVAFKADELPATYQFQARVSVDDKTMGGDGVYETMADGALSTFSGGAIEDLEWSVSGGEGASISEAGLLTVTGEGEYTVTCSALVKASTETMSGTAKVKAGDAAVEPKKDPQGDSHPQDVLKVESSVRFPAKGDTAQGGEGAAEGEQAGGGASGQAADASSGEAASAESQPGVQVSQVYGYDDRGGEGAIELSEAVSLSQSATVTMMNADGEQKITGNGFYLEELVRDAFERSGADYDASVIESVDFVGYGGQSVNLPWSQLTSASALVAVQSYVHVAASEASSSGESTDSGASGLQTQASGEEVQLNSDASSDTAGEGAAATASSGSSAATATADGDANASEGAASGDAGSGAAASADGDAGSGSASADVPLDNTRFRILFNSSTSAIDADSLRYISEIRVNGQEAQPKEEDPHDVAVTIDYTPVPLGSEATLTAYPTQEGIASWNFTWEYMDNGGKRASGGSGASSGSSASAATDGQSGSSASSDASSSASGTWQVLPNETSQQLKIVTSEATVGNYYRVRIDADTGGEQLQGVSEPVELQELSPEEWTVTLSYIPPVAGQVASFHTSLYGKYPGQANEYEYVWEWTEDGGKVWNTLDGENGPTLNIPTDPIDESASSGEGSEGGSAPATPLILVRARAIASNGEYKVSNVQALTVRVGDKNTDTPDSNDDSGVAGGESRPTGGAVNPPSGAPSSSGVTNPTTPVEVKEIVMENAPVDTEALDPESTQTAPAAPRQAGDPSQLTINKEVSEVVNEQKREQQEQVEAVTPGARWTSLNTIEPTGDDIQRVLENNPVAPLVIPFGLGLIAAGGLEKVLFFRRQLL